MYIRTYVGMNVYICTYVGMNVYTVEPLYYGHFGTLILVLITEVTSIHRSFNTLQYYTGTQNGVLIIEVSAIQRFVIERFHCTYVRTLICKYVCPLQIWACTHTQLYVCVNINKIHTNIVKNTAVAGKILSGSGAFKV